ncbi:DASH complex subunit Dad2-domain-containing protein [Neohortaea acidophila]|uniref:DASH complex subunit DAD2 n=1 Tax=Neohortaea acidophila TaxID=245834 RepID=A0A6A6PIU2_9PEZI|nr:DASH complex subunit Dad2-domain-containing protein [Neohortaea acidophila]KAF2479968.1 DASH complex subunit Dad2-domain-containing protein [Neohortaea acidophila]
MSYPARQPLPSHIRPSSGLANSNTSTSSTTQASLLQARINEKRVELESLRQLRDLSAGLAGQMQQLEQKLATLSDGTQAVAEVLGNWNSVLRAVHMASTKIPRVGKEGEGEDGEREELPQTLVRIPIQQAVEAQREAEAAAEAAGE